MSDASTNVTFFSGLMQTVADRGRALVGMRRVEPLGVTALMNLSRKLLTGRGEASGVANAQTIIAGYAAPEFQRGVFADQVQGTQITVGDRIDQCGVKFVAGINVIG